VKTGGCFSTEDTVELETGEARRLSDVSAGDRVLVVDDQGIFTFDYVITFLHKDPTQRTVFHELETADGRRLTLTSDHLIYSYSLDGDSGATPDSLTIDSAPIYSLDGDSGAPLNSLAVDEPIFAKDVRIESYLYSSTAARNGGNSSMPTRPRMVRVVAVREVVLQGVFAPLTTTGTIVVNGIVASCYASIASQRLAQAAMLPIRLLTYGRVYDVTGLSRGNDKAETCGDGIHWYACTLRTIANYLLPSSVWYTA